MPKDIWDALEVKTGRQITLWILTIVISAIFGNNIMEVIKNISQSPMIAGTLYITSFFIFRIILGYLFD
ncbi:MAG: hypothetical protein ACTSQG_10625 [Promethearchaeota archaeon]